MELPTVAAFDVGGTNVSAACFNNRGQLIGQVIEHASFSEYVADDSIATVRSMVEELESQTETRVTATGIAMPNPFDHDAGVSMMQHKFRALYGLPFTTLVSEQLSNRPVSTINDADAFCLGAYSQQAPDAQRIIGITLGTGVGSGFIEDGVILTSDDRIPPDGEIWDLTHGSTVLEDEVSTRGLMTYYRQLSGQRFAPEAIARLAGHGNHNAAATFARTGTILGECLAPICEAFKPEQIIIGGKISRALAFYQRQLEYAITQGSGLVIPVFAAQNDNLALYGAAKHVLAQPS